LIVTVTPNPSLDLTYRLPAGAADAEPVEVLRAETVSLEASGKGVNVSRTLLLSGVPNRCVLPLGGPVGAMVADLLAAAGVPADVVPQQGQTRINTSILAPGGSTKVNASGAALLPAEADALVAATDLVLRSGLRAGSGGPDVGRGWLAICGSLPPATDPALVDRLVEVARRAGVRSAVDSHGAALAAAVAAGADLIAPNAAELAALSPAVAAALAGGPELLAPAVVEFAAETGCQVLLSRGADGALWTDGRTALVARSRPVTPVNPAGAGDALLAGWLSGPDGDHLLTDRLARAVAWGTACCLAATTVADLSGVTGTDVPARRQPPAAVPPRVRQ
jgi:1-phosphofructokinase